MPPPERGDRKPPKGPTGANAPLCEGRNERTDTPCKRRVSSYGPYCWEHTKSVMHLQIKKSTIPGAGKGLFADRSNKRNPELVFSPNHPDANRRCICRYNETEYCEYLSEEQLEERQKAGDVYTMRWDKDQRQIDYEKRQAKGKKAKAAVVDEIFVSAEHPLAGYARWINDCWSDKKIQNAAFVTEYNPDTHFTDMWVFPLREIHDGEEIFVDYDDPGLSSQRVREIPDSASPIMARVIAFLKATLARDYKDAINVKTFPINKHLNILLQKLQKELDKTDPGTDAKTYENEVRKEMTNFLVERLGNDTEKADLLRRFIAYEKRQIRKEAVGKRKRVESPVPEPAHVAKKRRVIVPEEEEMEVDVEGPISAELPAGPSISRPLSKPIEKEPEVAAPEPEPLVEMARPVKGKGKVPAAVEEPEEPEEPARIKAFSIGKVDVSVEEARGLDDLIADVALPRHPSDLDVGLTFVKLVLEAKKNRLLTKLVDRIGEVRLRQYLWKLLKKKGEEEYKTDLTNQIQWLFVKFLVDRYETERLKEFKKWVAKYFIEEGKSVDYTDEEQVRVAVVAYGGYDVYYEEVFNLKKELDSLTPEFKKDYLRQHFKEINVEEEEEPRAERKEPEAEEKAQTEEEQGFLDIESVESGYGQGDNYPDVEMTQEERGPASPGEVPVSVEELPGTAIPHLEFLSECINDRGFITHKWGSFKQKGLYERALMLQKDKKYKHLEWVLNAEQTSAIRIMVVWNAWARLLHNEDNTQYAADGISSTTFDDINDLYIVVMCLLGVAPVMNVTRHWLMARLNSMKELYVLLNDKQNTFDSMHHQIAHLRLMDLFLLACTSKRLILAYEGPVKEYQESLRDRARGRDRIYLAYYIDRWYPLLHLNNLQGKDEAWVTSSVYFNFVDWDAFEAFIHERKDRGRKSITIFELGYSDKIPAGATVDPEVRKGNMARLETTDYIVDFLYYSSDFKLHIKENDRRIMATERIENPRKPFVDLSRNPECKPEDWMVYPERANYTRDERKRMRESMLQLTWAGKLFKASPNYGIIKMTGEHKESCSLDLLETSPMISKDKDGLFLLQYLRDRDDVTAKDTDIAAELELKHLNDKHTRRTEAVPEEPGVRVEPGEPGVESEREVIPEAPVERPRPRRTPEEEALREEYPTGEEERVEPAVEPTGKTKTEAIPVPEGLEFDLDRSIEASRGWAGGTSLSAEAKEIWASHPVIRGAIYYWQKIERKEKNPLSWFRGDDLLFFKTAYNALDDKQGVIAAVNNYFGFIVCGAQEVKGRVFKHTRYATLEHVRKFFAERRKHPWEVIELRSVETADVSASISAVGKLISILKEEHCVIIRLEIKPPNRDSQIVFMTVRGVELPLKNGKEKFVLFVYDAFNREDRPRLAVINAAQMDPRYKLQEAKEMFASPTVIKVTFFAMRLK